MADLESELKLKNWLSIVTFDVFKYMKAGGEVVIEQGDNGLTIAFPGVDLSTEGINKRFSSLVFDQVVEAIQAEPTP